jgi:GGDEF domain-containing protein
MTTADRFPTADLPDTPQGRQLRAGFPWLTFDPELEVVFRRAHFDENLLHTRVNLCLAVVITIAFAAMESMVLGPELNRVPGMIHMFVIIPLLLIGLASSFSPQRHRIYPPLAIIASTILGLGVSATQIIASLGGTPILFPCLMLTIIFIYFMGGLIFYHALAANVIVMLVYLAVGTELQLPGHEFAYDALAMVATNLFGASVVYMHEKSSRVRFLEACLLREMVARDGLTGIQNRRMFDQHIQRVWQQAVREEERVAVLLVDIDCFKDYNDRYGHQAGDECLRAVAVSLSQCARRPLDFVALWRRRVCSRAVRSEPRICRRSADANSALHSGTQYSPRSLAGGQPADREHRRGLHSAEQQSHARRTDPACRRSPVQRQGTGQKQGGRHGSGIPHVENGPLRKAPRPARGLTLRPVGRMGRVPHCANCAAQGR